MLVNAMLLQQTIGIYYRTSSRKNVKIRLPWTPKGQAAYTADLILAQLPVKIAYAVQSEKKFVAVVEIGLDDVLFPKRRERKICLPEWLKENSTAELVFRLLKEAKLSPHIEYVYDGGYGDRLSTNFFIVIPTPAKA